MAGDPGSKIAAVLGMLADLSPSAQARSAALMVPLDWFQWLPVRGVGLLRRPMSAGEVAEDTSVPVDRRFGERLASVDRIRPGEKRSLRVGWLFVAGRRPMADGRMQRVLHPLLSTPVRVSLPPLVGDALLRPAGDVALSELVADTELRHRLEAGYEVGGGSLDGVQTTAVPVALLQRLDRLHRFARAAARAAGLDATRVVPVTGSAAELLRAEELVIVAGVAVYTASEVGGLSAPESLRSWAGRRTGETAFHALYLAADRDGPEPAGPPADGDDVVAPFPLTPSQRRAVSVSRTAAVSVVSGAAGTGKSHAVSAIACDALGRGETVLMAAKTEAAVDALLARLGDAPGPEPVVFGSSERRDALARLLAGGGIRAADRDDVEASRVRLSEAVRAHRSLADAIGSLLAAEQYTRGEPEVEDEARRTAPRLFEPGRDLDEMRRLLDAAAGGGGWWARRRAGRARRLARELAGAREDRTDGELRAAVECAARARAAGSLAAAGGLEIGPDWARLARLEATAQRRVGEWLAIESRSSARLTRASLAALAVLGTALRSGRAARRAQLSRLDDRLTRALPLWVGTLGDIDDLLPPTPALFDLAILDEASAIDQPLAAAALLRARRVVVVGDPHQLRHVSFLADDQLRRAAAEHGLEDDPLLVGLLDVRRNSIFDVAVAASPPTVLAEHFRSAPHLVDFVARRLYRGQLEVATRSPRTEALDCVEVVRLTGRRDGAGVVRGEVDEVVGRLRAMVRDGVRSAGVVTPFRAQADALEEAVLAALGIDDIERLDLRVGTVHAFQGNERDVVLVSLGIGDTDSPTTWRFAEDANLFAVLATRARRRMVVILSADPPAGGLLADYLAQADAPPGPTDPAGDPGPWARAVAEGLAAAGVPTVPAYPVGRHLVDVCAGDHRRFVGLECGVHPAGPDAHVERHLALRRGGWDLVDAYESRWGERLGELLVELTCRFDGLPPPAP